MSPRRLFLAVAGLLVVIVGAQNLGTPRHAGPDEPAHIVRGAGLARGEVFGSPVTGEIDAGAADVVNADASHAAIRVFDVPAALTAPAETCFAHDPGRPASCATAAAAGPDPAASADGVTSTAATYPVWGHLLPGLATLVVPGSGAAWLARFLHGLIPVLLVAGALTRLLSAGRVTATSAVLVAVTPMALFLFAVVNPSGVVIGGAVALWVAGDELFAGRRDPGWLLPAGFAATVLPRDDGLLWAALIVGVLAAVHRTGPRAAWRALHRPARVVVTASALAGALWAALAGGDLVPVARPATGIAFAELVVQRTGRHLREAIGVLGWLDTDLPESMYLLWAFAAGLVVMVALAARQHRRAAGAAAALILAVVVGWVLEIVQGRTAGLFWQGRYALPLLIGLVLVAGLTPGADRVAGRAGAVAPGVLALVVWNVSFLQALRRWGVGAFGSIRPWAWDTYGAPLPVVLLVAIHVTASAGLGCLCLVRPRSGPEPAPH